MSALECLLFAVLPGRGEVGPKYRPRKTTAPSSPFCLVWFLTDKGIVSVKGENGVSSLINTKSESIDVFVVN